MNHDLLNDPYFKDEVHHDAPQRIAHRMLDIFNDEARWTQNAYARDYRGNRVDPGSPFVACQCLRTCMVKACHDVGLTFKDLDRTWKAFDKITGGMTAFNDKAETTFADIISTIRIIADGTTH